MKRTRGKKKWYCRGARGLSNGLSLQDCVYYSKDGISRVVKILWFDRGLIGYQDLGIPMGVPKPFPGMIFGKMENIKKI